MMISFIFIYLFNFSFVFFTFLLWSLIVTWALFPLLVSCRCWSGLYVVAPDSHCSYRIELIQKPKYYFVYCCWLPTTFIYSSFFFYIVFGRKCFTYFFIIMLLFFHSFFGSSAFFVACTEWKFIFVFIIIFSFVIRLTNIFFGAFYRWVGFVFFFFWWCQATHCVASAWYKPH